MDRPEHARDQQRAQNLEHDRKPECSRNQERRRQVRGLLLIAGAALLLLLHRASGQGVFHPGWWRL